MTVKLTNPGRAALYAEARLAPAGPLHLPRRLISTWLPPGYTRTVPVTISAAAGTAPGTYSIRVTDTGQQLKMPVTVSAPAPHPNLARSASKVTASSLRAGLLPCGAFDGDTDPTHWWNGTGWADGTPRTWPDWLRLTWPAPQLISQVEVATVDSSEYPAHRFGLRDWDIQVATPGGWETVAAVRGNTAATTRSTFAPRRAAELRILTHAANGGNDWSRILELTVH
ncbi:discoidin domain-containing protein [Actinoplanes sp. NBC_00393]|uniref:galactose-binding domain-containing protein n=1 Tax=Actinoplanes sp. NBC_00393 TaxID=2975953 RepID=UPI002E1BB831